MSYKSLLAVVAVSQPDEAIVELADVARAAKAHLTVLVAAIAPPFPAIEYAMVPDLWLRAREGDLEGLRSRAAAVSATLSRTGHGAEVGHRYVDAEWAHAVFGHWARCVDLSVIHQSLLADEALSAPVLNGLLFESGGPALIIPFGVPPSLSPRRAIVAWNGGIEAARALRAGMGVLSRSDEVVVTVVDPEASLSPAGGEPGADVARQLTRHGAKVRIDRLQSGDKGVAGTLADHARAIDADMIVMGAYGHSRLRERIFGGVTHSMLENLHRPLFIAH